MHRKIIWFCFFILTSLEISLNTRLTAQGKSHGVLPEPLLPAEETPLKEWSGGGAEAAATAAAGALRCSPAALALGARSLGAAHHAAVTLHNAGNATLHLTSISGSTPDFHASFFDTKTLPPAGNATFSVVFLGRREGLARATLALHTSLGVLHYNVSAVGRGAEWGLFPVRARIALGAPVRPLLQLVNPTDQPLQIQEVYSSAHWVGLELPDGGGGGGAPAALWTLAPRAAAPLVRLRLRPPPPRARAYIRVKTNSSAEVLVVRVEAAPAPAGLWAEGELRAAAGSRDPPAQLDVLLGNSAAHALPTPARLTPPRCAPHHAHDAAAPDPHDLDALDTYDPEKENGAGGGAWCGAGAWCGGARLELAREALPPGAPQRVATLHLHWSQLWAQALESAGADVEPAGFVEHPGWAGGALCVGAVLLGGLVLPYSATVLPGGLHHPETPLDFVTGSLAGAALREREVRVRNDFEAPLHVTQLDYDAQLDQYFDVDLVPHTVIPAGGWARLGALRPRPGARNASLSAELRLRTNVTHYTLPVRLYSGQVHFEWEWPLSAAGLELGALGVSQTRCVRGRLRNPGPAPLPLARLHAALPGAALTPHPPPAAPANTLVVEGGGSLELELRVVAPARAGRVRGVLHADTPHAAHALPLTLTAHRGVARLAPLKHGEAAPGAWSGAELRIENSMPIELALLQVAQAPPGDPALLLQLECGTTTEETRGPLPVPVLGAAGALGALEGAAGALQGALGARRCAWAGGGGLVGRLLYAPERACVPPARCPPALDMDSEEGRSWAARGGWAADEALRADAEAARARLQLFRARPAAANYSVHVRTDQVISLTATGSVTLAWPRLAEGGGRAGAGGVGTRAPFALRLRNPSASHALVVQPRLAAPAALPALPPALLPALDDCEGDCLWSPSSFHVEGWRALEGTVRDWGGAGGGLLLAAGARVELNLTLLAREARPLRALLLLRNNLTLLEAAELRGAGVVPRWELGPPRQPPDQPLLLEAADCGPARRALRLRNTGAVPVELRPALAGGLCQEGGFSVEPCEPLPLPPNASARITLSYTPDWTLARARRDLLLWGGGGGARRYRLHAAVPARLPARCAARAPPPPFDAALRPLGAAAALVALLFALALAALDSEAILKRAMAAMQREREPPRHAALLDLRAVGRAAAAPAPAPTPAAAPARHAPTRPAPPPPGPRPPTPPPTRHSPPRARPQPPPLPQPAPLQPSPSPPPARAAPPVQSSPPTPPQPQKNKKKTKKSIAEIKTDLTKRVRDSIEAADDWKPESAERAPPPGDSPPPGSSGSGSGGDASSPAADLDSKCSSSSRDDEDAASTGTDSSQGAAPPPPPAPRPEPRRVRDKYHAKRDKTVKRRAPPAPAPRPAPPRDPPPPPPPARRTATFSEIVAASPAPSPPARPPSPPAPAPPATPAPPPPAPRLERPLAPIGSDVRRRAAGAAPRTDNSLFFFNGEVSKDEYGWEAGRQAAGAAPAPRYEDEYVWRASEVPRWGWGYEMRPPPGFAAPPPAAPPAAAPPPVRAYDPFHAMAAIWAPGRHAWTGDDDRTPH